MATTPEEVQQQPKFAQRVMDKITAPVGDHAGKQRVVFVAIAAAATTAPQPFAGLMAALILALAYDRKR
jgi:hypothetical protein